MIPRRSQGLLPSGFMDMMPREAWARHQCSYNLIQLYACYGYDLVRPPLVEHEETFLGPRLGGSLDNQTFRVIDPDAQGVMVLRSDTTPQIARIARTRLKEAARPLRLCYANDVLRVSAGQQRASRQFTQVGCEVVGEKCLDADVECVVLAVESLKIAGIEGISVDLNLPIVVPFVLDRLKDVGASMSRQAAKAALRDRDLEVLRGYDKAVDVLCEGIEQGRGCPSSFFDIVLAPAQEVLFPQEVWEALIRLKDLFAMLGQALAAFGTDVRVSVDVFEQRGFRYQTGFAFSLFASNSSSELGRGGRYYISDEAGTFEESAVGFTLYLDVLMKAVPRSISQETEEKVFVPYGETWQVVQDVLSQGYKIVRGNHEDAKSSGCSHIAENGEINKL